MKNQAFTLIELLVVVLIIGILTAIAVPQYQKAVDKSRFSQLKLAAHAIANAEEVYFLQHGKYAADLPSLDINFNQGTYKTTSAKDGSKDSIVFDWGICSLTAWLNYPVCELTNPKVAYYVHISNNSKFIQCVAQKTASKRAMDLCRQAMPGATETYFESGYCSYPCTLFRY